MSKITYLKSFWEIGNFWLFLLHFMGIFGIFFFFWKLLKMEKNWFNLVEQVSEMSKINSAIVYAPCLNITIIRTNKKQMNSSADTVFWITCYRVCMDIRCLTTGSDYKLSGSLVTMLLASEKFKRYFLGSEQCRCNLVESWWSRQKLPVNVGKCNL